MVDSKQSAVGSYESLEKADVTTTTITAATTTAAAATAAATATVSTSWWLFMKTFEKTYIYPLVLLPAASTAMSGVSATRATAASAGGVHRLSSSSSSSRYGVVRSAYREYRECSRGTAEREGEREGELLPAVNNLPSPHSSGGGESEQCVLSSMVWYSVAYYDIVKSII